MRQPLRASVEFDLAEVALAVGLPESDRPPGRIAGVATDSRDVRPGDLFVARRGVHTDGHLYVARAEAAGAAAILAEQPLSGLAVPVLVVADATAAMGALGRYHRRRLGLPLVAVTGSNGKTTTKEMLAAILAEHVGGAEHVLATQGNFNNHVGLPLTLLSARPEHRLGVVELGMSAPGEIAALAALAEPEVGLITNAGRAHLEGLGSVEAVARAKAELWEALGPGGTAVVPADDVLLAPLAEQHRGHRLRFGEAGGVDVRLAEVVPRGAEGLKVALELPKGRLVVRLPLVGRHNARNAAAAAAAAVSLGVEPAAIAEGLARVKVPGHRAQVVALGQVWVLDDCYNANPDSLLAALETLADLPGAGRRCAVVGDLLELGESSESLHREVGAELARQAVACVIGVGPATEALCDAARQHGVAEVVHVADAAGALAPLRARLRPGDRWLVKGSRGVGLEQLLQGLRDDAQHQGAA